MSGETRHAPLVVHVVHALRTGGLENGLVNLINRTPPERYRHAIVCLTGYDRFAERIERDDVRLFALDKREGKDPGIYFRAWRVFRQLRPDIVHTRNLGTLDMLVPAWLAGVPIRVHGEHGRDMVDLHGTHPRYLRLRRLLRPLAHRYIGLSHDLSAYLADTVGAGRERVETICNGVDLARFRPDPSQRARLRAELGWDEDACVIGWVGRMEPVKNPVGLARAFVRLCERDTPGAQNARLVMIGGGSRVEEVRECLDAAGLGDRAWLPGPSDDIPGLLRAMDLFVLPSLAEGISNTILEAMASGLPVVATRVGGNAELVADGETGTIVDSAEPESLSDAIAPYVAEPERLAAQGRAARRRAEAHFDLDGMVSAYLDLYDRLLAARGQARALGSAHSEAG
jgi:sugar transferase (PEP-CTERM/EpsH1 system associated)